MESLKKLITNFYIHVKKMLLLSVRKYFAFIISIVREASHGAGAQSVTINAIG